MRQNAAYFLCRQAAFLCPFGYTKVEPLAFSSDCISVDENTVKLAFFILERMKWCMSVHNAVHFLAVKPNPFPNSVGQVFTFLILVCICGIWECVFLVL